MLRIITMEVASLWGRGAPKWTWQDFPSEIIETPPIKGKKDALAVPQCRYNWDFKRYLNTC